MLTIERVEGVKLASAVGLTTEEPSGPVTVGDLTFEPAQASVHFTAISSTINFEVNNANISVAIGILLLESTPRAFYVNLEEMNNE